MQTLVATDLDSMQRFRMLFTESDPFAGETTKAEIDSFKRGCSQLKVQCTAETSRILVELDRGRNFPEIRPFFSDWQNDLQPLWQSVLGEISLLLGKVTDSQSRLHQEFLDTKIEAVNLITGGQPAFEEFQFRLEEAAESWVLQFKSPLELFSDYLNAQVAGGEFDIRMRDEILSVVENSADKNSLPKDVRAVLQSAGGGLLIEIYRLIFSV